MRAAAADEIAVYGYALALLAFGGFLVYLFASGRLQGADATSRRRFVAALLSSAAWAVFAGIGVEYRSPLWPAAVFPGPARRRQKPG